MITIHDYIRIRIKQANNIIKKKLMLEMNERFLKNQRKIFEGLKEQVENLERKG